MDEASQIKKREAVIQKRIDFDLLSRSLPGIVIYAIVWPLIFYPLEFHKVEPLICWGGAAVLFGLSIIRGIQARFTNVSYIGHETRWLAIFSICSLAQALVWGSLFYLSISATSFDSVRIMLVLAVGGLSSGALSALMPRLWLALFNVTLVLIPGLIAAYFIKDDISLSALIIVYYVYLILLGKRTYSEYMRAFQIEGQLESQRFELERLNKIDPLTMIFNRGYFNSTFDFQWNNGIRTRQHQSLLLIDVDFFKSINDKYGHLCGDDCLIKIARSIHTIAKRKTDLIARFGGEEFVVLLSNTSLNEARSLAESIREEVEQETYEFEGNKIAITVSIGVASMIPTPQVSSNQLIENADVSLYQAKSDGRNCVRFFNQELPS